MGIQLYFVDGVLVDNNRIYSGPTGTTHGAIYIEAAGGYKSKNITITNNWVHGWNAGVEMYTEDIDGDITITNNILYTAEEAILGNNGTMDDGSISIYNNTLMGTSGSTFTYSVGLYIDELPVGTELYIKNNIMSLDATDAAAEYIKIPKVNNGTIEIDYNQYWNSSFATPFEVHEIGKINLADWNTAGYDGNSPNVVHGDADYSPLFKNAGGSYALELDFDLQTTSPAIDAGIDVAIDFLGTAPDIGKYEKR